MVTAPTLPPPVPRNHPTPQQVLVAVHAARGSIQAYSSFYSGMVPDSALEAVVHAALDAALNVFTPATPKGPSHA